MTKWLLLAGAVACEVAGSLSLKGALNQPAFYALVVGGYLASFTMLAATLARGVPLGVAYGTWAALGVAATALLSALIFGESLTPLMGVGMGMVILGVLAIEFGSQAAKRHAAEGVS